MKHGIVKILVFSSAALAGCATTTARDTSASATENQRVVSVQCSPTDTNVDTPCVEEARQACASEARLKEVMSRNVIPATQGVNQSTMPLTRYVARYACQ